MGELRNVETHDALYYPSTFHAVASVFSQLTSAAPTSAYTLNSVAAAVWLFPASAAILTWKLLRDRFSQWQAAGAAATAAALSASFTAIPYIEFDTASMPNLAAYGVAVPAMALVMSAVGHRDRIPLAVLALLGVFSVHITGGVVTVLFVAAWWLVDALWHPVRGRLSDFIALVLIAVPTVCLLLPQFVGVLQQAEIIEGHAFVTHEGKKRGLIDALVQHTRHLNDFPIQWVLIVLAGVGGLVLLVQEGVVAACGVAGPRRVHRAFVGAVRRPARRPHRQIQRPLLQRPAQAVGRGGDAAGPCRGTRAVRDWCAVSQRWQGTASGAQCSGTGRPQRC